MVDGESPSPTRPSSSRSSRRSPKKGRLDLGPGNLDKTTEEEQQDLDPSETNSHCSGPTPVPAPSAIVAIEGDSGDEHKMVISVSGSPPHETKMRQISEGVHGIEMKKVDTGDDGRVVVLTPFPTAESPAVEVKPIDPEEPPAKRADPVLADGAVTSAVTDDVLLPLDRKKRGSTDSLPPVLGSRRGSDSSVEQEKGLKRKFGDRAVSESRETERVGKKASKKDVTDAATTSAAGTKRARDEESKDPNPKEAKRPSPPPEKAAKTQAERSPVASSSKVVPSKVVSVCIRIGKIHSLTPYRSASWHTLT